MNNRAIIFDMDGTIVDTEVIWQEATNRLIANKNLSLTLEQQRELQTMLHGLATPEACAIIKDVGKLSESLEDLVQEKRNIAHYLYTSGILQFIPGFPEFHAQIRAAQIPTGIATNADEGTLATTNRLMNLASFFGEHLYSIAHVNNRCKPNPDIYLHVADKLKADPHHCIAIEDSAHGIAAAKAAGMVCIGINTGKDRYQLREADTIIEDYTGLTLASLWKNL